MGEQHRQAASVPPFVPYSQITCDTMKVGWRHFFLSSLQLIPTPPVFISFHNDLANSAPRHHNMASFQPRTRDSSARELVTRVMSPRIAVIASQGATELCQANYLSSVVDLLRPFGERIEGRGNSCGTATALRLYDSAAWVVDQLLIRCYHLV